MKLKMRRWQELLLDETTTKAIVKYIYLNIYQSFFQVAVIFVLWSKIYEKNKTAAASHFQRKFAVVKKRKCDFRKQFLFS